MTIKEKYIASHFILPVLLFILGTFLFYKYLFDNGFGVFNLLNTGYNNDLVSTRSGDLLAGDKIYGRFNSRFQNMGIVSVRFTNQNRDSDDILIFSLKEEGQDNWYYQAKYNTDQFLPGKLFPFGFPTIENSAGKNYVFELESVRGATGSGIVLDRKPPPFIAASFFDKQGILLDSSKTAKFLFQKTLNVVGNSENLISVLIYFSPFIFYILFLLSVGMGYQFLTEVTLFAALLDIFYLKYSSDFLIVAISFIWYLTVRRFRFQSRISAAIALVFLIFTPILLILNNESFAEKTAVWAYLFLCFTLVQKIYENKYHPKKLFEFTSFVHFKSFTHFKSFINNISKLKIPVKNKKNHIIIKVANFAMVMFSLNSILTAYQSIVRNYRVFGDYYPEFNTPPNLKGYMVVVGFCTLLFLTALIFLRKFLAANKTALLLLALFFQFAINFSAGKFTGFQFTPKIFSISPSSTSEAWVDITIHGRNFQDLPFIGKITVNNVVQGENLISWSDKKIIFRTNPTVTKSGPVCVQTLSKGNSNCVNLEYNFGKANKKKL